MRLILVLILLAIAATAGYSEMVPFVLPWDDASSGPTNLSSLLDAPAGKSGFVKVKGSHLYSGSKRLRLFGVNITTSACFPEHADAEKVAGRLAKFGVNCVRFHHMDAVWSDEVIFTPDKRTLDSSQLEKLDYFIYQLKKHGIYADINLHVSREYPDMPAWPQHPEFYKGVDIFYEPMISSQMDYARELLLHRNPYTKNIYAQEPAVALVEINNEDGLLALWATNALDNMPEPYSGTLEKLWSKWLTTKYKSTQSLLRAWSAESETLGPEMLQTGSYVQSNGGWLLERHGTAAAEMDSAKSIRVNVTNADGTSWHIQLVHPETPLEKNRFYTLKFKVRADKDITASVALQQNYDPWESVCWLTFEAGPEWTEHSFIVRSDRTDPNMRLIISGLGSQTGSWEFSEVSLRPGANFKRPESLLKAEFIRRKEIDSYGPTAKADWLQFLWETEQNYWRRMQRFLKEEIKCSQPIIGTAVGFSPATMQSDMDVVDSHSYWHHPEFPVRPWDSEEWIVRNRPMAGDAAGGTLGTLSTARIFGKPFTVTEYNHPAPNTYSSETMIILAAYAGLQDWDGIFAFEYQGNRNAWNGRRIGGFFDIDQHPAKMATLPAAAAMFLRGDIRPAKEARVVDLPNSKLMQILAQNGPWLSAASLGLSGLEGMRYRVGQSVNPGKLKPSSLEKATKVRSDTGELLWNTEQKQVTLDSPRSKAAIGIVNGQSIRLGEVEITLADSAQNWAMITLTSMDGKPISYSRKILLTATAGAENTDMKWKDASRESVGTNWGVAPSIVETISAVIYIKSASALKVWSLDERGQKNQPVGVIKAKEGYQFTLASPTLWYVIESSK